MSVLFLIFLHDIIYVVSLLVSFDTVSSCYHVDTFLLRLRQILRFCINGRLGIISSNHKLYIYLIVNGKIKLVGWFIEIVELKKYGVMLGAVLSKFRLIKKEYNF